MATTEHRPTERVLDILELLSNSEDGMTLTELSKALNAPKSSIMPLVHTMTARNFIYMQKNTLRYFIGVATYSVGITYNNRKTSLQFIQQEMSNITTQTNETCQLGIQSRNMVLYIAKKRSTSANPSDVFCRKTTSSVLYWSRKSTSGLQIRRRNTQFISGSSYRIHPAYTCYRR